MKICYTVCSLNRLGQVLALAASVRRYNSDYRFVLCLADEWQGRIEAASFKDLEVIALSELGLPEHNELSARYNIFELSCALKAYFGQHLYRKYNPDFLLYFDTDLLVYSNFSPIEEGFSTGGILLTPHYTQPFPDKDKFPLERDVLNAGLYNGGFVGLKKTKAAEDFLAWWQQRLKTQGYNNVCEGMMVDQLWLNLVPLYFPETVVSRHPGCNLAYWNLHERRLEETASGFAVNGEPLVFFHFSGFRIHQPERLSQHQNRIRESNHPAVMKLLAAYRDELVRCDFEKYLAIPPVYGNDGIKKKIPLLKRVLIDGLAKAGYSLQKIRKV